MEKELRNWIHNGKVREHEWNIDAFFEGPICYKSSLRRINEFTEKDKKRLEELENMQKNPYLTNNLYEALEKEAIHSSGEKRKYLWGLLKNPACTERELDQIRYELEALQFKEVIKKWEGALYEGKVKIKIITGWTCCDCSEYEEILLLDGDDDLVDKVIQEASASETDKTMAQVDYCARRKELIDELESAHDIVVSHNTVTFVPKKSYKIE
jgi:hypothetical protein